MFGNRKALRGSDAADAKQFSLAMRGKRTTRTRRFQMFCNRVFTCPLFVLLTIVGFLASAHAADSCQPLFDAITKLVTTPSHSYSTGVVNGEPRSTETIYAKERLT
jgi:hypothetical protein